MYTESFFYRFPLFVVMMPSMRDLIIFICGERLQELACPLNKAKQRRQMSKLDPFSLLEKLLENGLLEKFPLRPPSTVDCWELLPVPQQPVSFSSNHFRANSKEIPQGYFFEQLLENELENENVLLPLFLCARWQFSSLCHTFVLHKSLG